MILDAKIPEGPLSEKWANFKKSVPLVSPANKRKLDIIVVGTGLAGSSAAATLAGLGYNIKAFCFQDTPRRAHSIAAQGGINAAKNYPGDGDSIERLFNDTIKGGDFRSREANVYRLAEVSQGIIDQSVAQGVPFAREYGGQLDNRSFGGAQVSRTFYAKGQTGQQLLLGAYSAYNRQVQRGKICSYVRHEMLDIVLVEGKARGIITRDLVTGAIKRFSAHAVVIATGGYANIFYLSSNAMGCNATAAWKAYKKGAGFANPCFTQIHPTCIPSSGEYQSKLTLMSESLRNDGRVWVPKDLEVARKIREGGLLPNEVPEQDRDYYLERRYPAFGNLVPRDVAARAAKERCDAGFGVNTTGQAVFLDFRTAIELYGKEKATLNGRINPRKEEVYLLGKQVIEEKYGNLFQMYQKITAEDPYKVPMKIFPAAHYTMGGLWVDYHLMTTIPGCYAIGEANFSDHGANRLGASALMQGLADGYFILPYTIGAYLSEDISTGSISDTLPEFDEVEQRAKEGIQKLFAIKGNTPPELLHRRLGKLMWDKVGISRHASGLVFAREEVKKIKASFWKDLKLVGSVSGVNQELEKAIRVLDFIELSELVIKDAIQREESCGGHFRKEYQTESGEASRRDDAYLYVSVWQYKGQQEPDLIKEKIIYEYVHLTKRSYK